GIAEARLLGEAGIAVFGPIDVQEHRPGLDVEAACARGLDQLGQRVARSRQTTRPRLHRVAAPDARVGSEEDLSTRLEAQPPGACVRKEVARGVVGGRHGHTAQTGAVLHVVEHRVDSLVGEISRKAECRRPHATPHHAHNASARTEVTSSNSSTATYSADEWAWAKSPGP